VGLTTYVVGERWWLRCPREDEWRLGECERVRRCEGPETCEMESFGETRSMGAWRVCERRGERTAGCVGG
jgi:hypothetical protein